MQPALVMLLLSWVGGIGLGVATDEVAWLLLVLAGVLTMTKSYKLPAATSTACLLVACLGFVYGDAARPDLLSNCSASEELRGQIMVRPDIRENSVRYLLSDDRGCRYFVYTERWPVYERDTALKISGGKFRDQAAVLAEEPDFGRYLVRQSVAGVWSYPRITVVALVQSDETYRQVLARVHALFPEPDASIIGAMLFAERGQLSDELTEYFRRTSLTHILSISGAHISLLTGMLFVLISFVPLKPLVKTSVIIVLLWGYVLFVGAPVAAVRAGFFWSVTLVALRLGLLVSLPTAIILTLTLMLTRQPLMVLDIGLQLSFMAVTGIFLALFITKPWRGRLPQGSHGIVSALIVSTGATALTWPLISYYFGTISLSAVIANLLILPAVPVIMGGSMVAMGVSYISDLGARLVALPVHAAMVWMLGIAGVLGRLPGTWLALTMPFWGLVIYYSCLVGVVVVALQAQKRTWREVWE